MSDKYASTTDLELWLLTVLHWFWKHSTLKEIKMKYLVSSFIEILKIHFIYFKRKSIFWKNCRKSYSQCEILAQWWKFCFQKGYFSNYGATQQKNSNSFICKLGWPDVCQPSSPKSQKSKVTNFNIFYCIADVAICLGLRKFKNSCLL